MREEVILQPLFHISFPVVASSAQNTACDERAVRSALPIALQ
jgi:hypothetical protein